MKAESNIKRIDGSIFFKAPFDIRGAQAQCPEAFELIIAGLIFIAVKIFGQVVDVAFSP